MAGPTTLFGLFGDFTSNWPTRVVQEDVGIVNPLGQPANPGTWLAALNAVVTVGEVRFGALDGRAAVQAELRMAAPSTYSEGWPFVLAAMPDVEFRIQAVSGADRFVSLFGAVSDRGVEIVLERLPVEIRLPTGLVAPRDADETTTGQFTAGNLDDLMVVYRTKTPTSVFVHVRLHMTEDMEFSIRPAVPISFGRCRFSDLPCLAVHDFTLIPSPSLALDGPLTGQRLDEVEWLRHRVTPWLPSQGIPLVGQFAVRSLHLDPNEDPMRAAATALAKRREGAPPAGEFVLDDAVVPFFSPYLLPIPRHITVGIRRRVVNPEDAVQAFSFAKAPIRLDLSASPKVGAIIESFFFRSQPDIAENLGLSFLAALLFGEAASQNNALTVGVGEHYTLRAGYRRDYSALTGLPVPPGQLPGAVDAFLHHEIALVVIDIMAITVGYSIGRAVRGASFGDAFECTVDIFISVPPTQFGLFRLSSLSGQRVAFGMEGLGWRFGSFTFEGFSAPDGVVAYFGPVGLVIEEFGVAAESGASYLSFSGGVKVELTGFQGGVTVRRLRFRLRGGGNPDAPPFKLDGFFLFFRTSTVSIEAGGYYSEERVGDTQVREFGLTGTVKIGNGSDAYVFGLDLILGDVRSPSENFSYLMFQVFFRGSLTVAWFELRGARLLFARSMQPKLDEPDRDSHELRYLNWYHKSDPLKVEGNRRLNAWQSRRGQIAVGVGVNATISGMSKVFELGVFVLVLVGEDERGFLIVGEVFALSSTTPVGYIALEWDGKNDRFSMLIGVDVVIRNFLAKAPAFINNLGRITGTLFISNDPGTVALGRLADQRTWLGLRFDVQFLGQRQLLEFALCFEHIDRPTGPKGFGLLVRIEGAIDLVVAQLEYHAGLGALIATFTTGSTDYAILLYIEVGLRIVLIRFLRFGIDLRVELRIIGSNPRRGELKAEIHIETPWFLPDFTFTLEKVFGELKPAQLGTSASPLRSAASISGPTQKSLPVHAARADPAWNGEGPSRTFSIVELRTASPTEATRVPAFDADIAARPVPTDSTISIEWSVPVTDTLALNTNVAAAADQRAGDLALRYELVGLSVRRRPRFGTSRPWSQLEQRVELAADFSDPTGVKLTGSLSPQTLTKFWDLDVQVEGRLAAKRLLLNAATPFEFKTISPEADEQTVTLSPDWPCCSRGFLSLVGLPPPYRTYELTFRDGAEGRLVTRARFADSDSELVFFATARVRRQRLDPGAPADRLVAFVSDLAPGVLARVELAEDAAFCGLRLAVPPAGFSVVVRAEDADGTVVATQSMPTGGGGGFQSVTLIGSGPIRRVEIQTVGTSYTVNAQASIPLPQQMAVELDRVAYVALADYLAAQLDALACAPDPNARAAYEGRGKLSFLPNHDYEIAVRTRVTVNHPTTGDESADVDEYVLFRTKGLPGLNAVARVGEEIEPYVRSAYTGGRGILYREEPVVLAFRENFPVAVPVPLRPGTGSAAERVQLLRMQLLVRPDIAPAAGTTYTTNSDDWITTHAGTQPSTPATWNPVLSTGQTIGTVMTSDDPARDRLAGLIVRERSRCHLDDPRTVIGPVLIAPAQGSPDLADPTRQLWPAVGHVTATVVPQDAGFVDHESFGTADLTAFDLALDNGPGDVGAWTVAGGSVHASGSAARRFAIFGEDQWDYLSVQVGVHVTSGAAGVGVALPGGSTPSRGLFAVVAQTAAGRRLAIHRRRSGSQFELLTDAPLPAAADPTAAVSVVVTAFDDRLRASVGDVTVEADREELRNGRLCLLADGEASFTSLAVSGLEMYRFPVTVSRFRSFAEHIGSFAGRVEVVTPDALGAGTTTTTPAALWTTTRAQVVAAMKPDAEPSARQAVFDRWIGDLGLPLQQEVNALEVSRYADGGQTGLLMMESPEPVDFTEEVELTLARRVVAAVVGSGPAEIVPAVLLSTDGNPAPADVRTDDESAPGVLDQAVASVEAALFGAGAPRPQRPRPLLIDLVHDEGELVAEFDPTASSVLGPVAEVTFIEVLDAGGQRRYLIYRGPVEDNGGRANPTVVAPKIDELDERSGGSVLLPVGLQLRSHGDVVAVIAGTAWLVARFPAQFTYAPVDTAVIQDGTGARALILPISGNAAAPAPSGTYRLSLRIRRQRWVTLDEAATENRYEQVATLAVSL